jgi:hypothetical protein
MRRPADTTPPTTTDPTAPDLSTIGTPVNGTWGSGRLITTAVGSAIVTDDGRIAAGAAARAGAHRRALPVTVAVAARILARPSPPVRGLCKMLGATVAVRMSTSTSPTAPYSACSAPTARARPPSSGCCSA